MTILEAYEIGMAIVAELEASGIPVKKVFTGQREHNKNSKYLTPDRLPLDKYLHISFIPRNEDDWTAIFAAGDELYKQGISFDSGAGGGERDWEFDWSFAGPETERMPQTHGDEGDNSVCCDDEGSYQESD